MCINTLLIVWVEGLACCCHCSHCLVGQNEYQGAAGSDGAVPVSGKGVLECHGAQGGARSWLGGPALCDGDAGCPNADRPGLGGLLGGWARVTKSSPDQSDSLSDSGN